MDGITLIAFDLDGVLIDGPGSWMEVHARLGTQPKAEENAKAFFEGRITFDEWAFRDTELWRGVKVDKIIEILYDVSLMEGADKTLRTLKSAGYKIAIITGGLKILADRVCDNFKLDHSLGNEFVLEKGRVCGIKKDVDFYGKGEALKSIAKKEGISTRECACIGDHLNDIPMFKVSGYSIAFNPKSEELIKYADDVVYGKNLEEVLPYFTQRECKLPPLI